MPTPPENDDIISISSATVLLAKKRMLLALPGARALRDELQLLVQADRLGYADGDYGEIGDEAQSVRDRYIRLTYRELKLRGLLQ